ncbi:PREDICTED: ATP-dependent DNA helicase DDX11 [Tarenaya hassleriana]|uniref:ATP-dependent DNA helicase DDX11 n=1 Tax=Tarenaya hassleriana TaxID=28532 RepID=UPI00053C2A67|nr:PREDICTED: ATP-dependent DNA helicase DDX11 [Tarenaya hassleriana]
MTEEQEFPAFPYEPYPIQIDFMKALYQSLEKGGVSMLESPTGTGKTLSIISSALQWVIDRKAKERSGVTSSDRVDANNGKACSDDEPDWMRDFTVNKNDNAHENNFKNTKSPFRLRKHANKRVSDGDLFLSDPKVDDLDSKKQRDEFVNKNHDTGLNDEEFLLEEYESEEESFRGERKSKRKSRGAFDSSSGDEVDEEGGSDEEDEGLKVFFCSRTHSQLSQFVKELRKTVFANEIKAVCLGSRKNLCINEDVLKLGNAVRINERCLELQKKKRPDISKLKNLGTNGRIRRTKAYLGCPMLRKHKLQREFKNEISQKGVMDIEDLVQLGRGMGTCPYYGSRRMLPAADLVVLPYQSLLSKPSRESLGLNLKNNIVIIDEAHNLADTLISMYDAKITLSQLDTVQCSIEKYLGRFRNLLGAGNRRYIQTLLVLTRALLKPLANDDNLNSVNDVQDTENLSASKSSGDSAMAINDFLFSLNIDNINLVKLLQYVKESNIIHKVSSYGDRVAMLQKDSATHEEMSTSTSFRAFSDMLLALTNNNGDGRIIISRQQGGHLKYVMLTGEKIFSEIVDQAHAVVLAGGTLQPIEETRERLFPWLPSNQLQFFSCSHIVPPESILPIAVSHGPSGRSFDFCYSSRSSMIQELGLLISNLVAVVPEGIIIFFSSFEYESQVYCAWNTSGILKRIMKKKLVFREPRRNTQVEVVLNEYREAIDRLSNASTGSQNGAIMLAVVGGKVSEGINFSDSMCRCVVMVGLPYPNPSDIELLERIKHIEGLGDLDSAKSSTSLVCESHYGEDVQAGFDILRTCKRRGKEYYENLCMKAVNQSIGRAIRHINDYAAILLVDARYSDDPSKRTSSHPRNKLPLWIKDCLVSSTKGYGEVHRLLHQFFRHRNRGN